MIKQRGLELLQRCEKGLRELVAEAATSGDYESIISLTSWARTLANLVEAIDTTKATFDRLDATNGQDNPPDQTKLAPRSSSRIRRLTQAKSPPKRNARIQSPRKSIVSAYPKFFRRGDELIKVGWSKREKKEYQHKAPHKSLLLLVTAVMKAGTSGKLFTADNLMPLINPDDGSEVPDYQIYLCLSWLRHQGLVKQHGRQGYSIPKLNDLASSVELGWLNLPEI